jgi:hypothetical protein
MWPVVLTPIVFFLSTASLWLVALYGARKIKKMESRPPDLMEMVPLAAGILGGIAMLLMPFPQARSWSWLPLIFSVSSITNLCYATWWGIHFKKWPWNNSVKSDRLVQ